MSYPQVYNWPAPDTEAICLLQSDIIDGENFIINGHLLINNIQPGNIIFPGISRTISITSTDDCSNINYTINGTLNGSFVTQTIAGPNNETIESTQLFDTITSISGKGGPFTRLRFQSIGSGTSGNTHWFSHDYNKAYPSLSLQGVITGTMTYTWNATLDNPNNIIPTLFQPISALDGATTNELQSIAGTPLSFSNVSITSGSTGTLFFTVVEGGLTS